LKENLGEKNEVVGPELLRQEKRAGARRWQTKEKRPNSKGTKSRLEEEICQEPLEGIGYPPTTGI